MLKRRQEERKGGREGGKKKETDPILNSSKNAKSIEIIKTEALHPYLPLIAAQMSPPP